MSLVLICVASALAGEPRENDAAEPFPVPQVVLDKTEAYTLHGVKGVRYHLKVENWQDYSDDLFVPSPQLPPIGRNQRASRTTVRIQDEKGRHLYGFVSFSKAASLQRLWFAVRQNANPPDSVTVELFDRKENRRTRSKPVAISAEPNLEARVKKLEQQVERLSRQLTLLKAKIAALEAGQKTKPADAD